MSELERRIASHVERSIDAQSPVTLAEVTTRRALRDRRRPIVAGAVALAFAATAIAVASRDNRGGVPIIANTSSTVGTPSGVTTRIELLATRVTAGESLSAELIIDNQTGSPIPLPARCVTVLARVFSPEIDNTPTSNDESRYCTYEPPKSFPIGGGWMPIETPIPVGISRIRLNASTNYSQCERIDEPGPKWIPLCAPWRGNPPTLPSGEYKLTVDTSDLGLPTPEPIELRVFARPLHGYSLEMPMTTHCGVRGLMVGDIWWEVRPTLDGASGLRWNDPVQIGEVRIVGDTATDGVFDAGEGRVVRIYRTNLTSPPFVCY